ncbi:MAG: hypothetical protein ABF384_12440 [Verrucomicrobiales bacterium]
MRFILPFSSFLLLPTVFVFPLSAQDERGKESTIEEAAQSDVAIKLDISRRHLRNFLTDEEALEAYGSDDARRENLHGAFMIGSPGARYVAIWDPTAARLIGVLDVEPPKKEQSKEEEKADNAGLKKEDAEKEELSGPSPYIYSAEGLPPFQESSGAFGKPEYFGFRVVAGRPKFLYTHGSLRIEEMIWLEDEGRVLKQRFSIRSPQNDAQIAVVSDWKDRITHSVGEWDGSALKVSKDEAGNIELSYQLEPAESESKKEKEE